MPDMMDAGDVPTVTANEGASAAPGETSSEDEDQAAPTPVTLREASACMARAAEFIQVTVLQIDGQDLWI